MFAATSVSELAAAVRLQVEHVLYALTACAARLKALIRTGHQDKKCKWEIIAHTYNNPEQEYPIHKLIYEYPKHSRKCPLVSLIDGS